MTENVAAVTLTRQQQASQLTQFGEDTTKGGKSIHESGRKTCFQCGGNYHILEIAHQKARSAINAKSKVILKDAADQR